MEAPSGLERFLDQHRSEGTTVDEGQFTLAKEVALKKLSSFTLPFQSAWILKLIQSAITQQNQGVIDIHLGARGIDIHFPVDSWTWVDIEQAFYNPEPSPESGIRHLITALWALGLQLKWPFQLYLPSEPDLLVWDGEALCKIPNEGKSETRLGLEVLPRDGREQSGLLGWFAGRVKAGRANADLQTTLYRWAYMCPKPLRVDSVRVDAIQNVGKRGGRLVSYPISIGTAPGELPELSIPPGSLSGQLLSLGVSAGRPSMTLSDPKMCEVSRTVMAGQTVDLICSVPFLLSVNYRMRTSGKNQDKVQWDLVPASSQVHWVRDGVLVDRDPLWTEKSHVSVDLFLNAEGLDADLSTFTLRRTPERTARIQAALRSVVAHLGDLSELRVAFERYVDTQRRSEKQLAGVVMGLGFLGTLLVPVFGVCAGAVGFWKLLRAGDAESELMDSLMNEIRSVVSLVEQRAHSLPANSKCLDETFVWSPPESSA